MSRPRFNKVWKSGFPSQGFHASSNGSTLVVANLASNQLNVLPGGALLGDPWVAQVAESDSQPIFSSDSISESSFVSPFSKSVPNHDNIRPIAAQGWNYANFYHIWRGNNTVTTAPRIQVFGKLPAPANRKAAAQDFLRAWPHDDDPDFPDVFDFWVPLVEPASTTAYIDLGTAAAGRFMSSMYIGLSKYVYLQGVTEIAVLVQQAAVFTNTQQESMSSGASSITEFSSSSSSASDTSYGLIGVQFSG